MSGPLSDPIFDTAGRRIAPPQSWPEPAPERPRRADVTIHERTGRVWTIHGVAFLVGYWDGVLVFRSAESRQDARDSRLEIEWNFTWSEDEAYTEYQRRLAAA